MKERCYAEVDLGVIKSNYRIYRSHLYPHQRVICVVKANAYGHGAREVAHAIEEEGGSDFAVATLEEGVALREGGIRGSVLILGHTPPHLLCEAIGHRLTQTVADRAYAREVHRLAPSLPVQLAVDTGMHRLGFSPTDPSLAEYAGFLNVKGIFTHLAAADEKGQAEFTFSQLSAFEKAANSLDKRPEYTHALNSAGGLLFNTGASSHIRLGIMLYGISPSKDATVPRGVRPALTWRAALVSTRLVERGESVGYGRSFVARRRTLVGTVSVGYADGYPRRLSGIGRLTVGGVACPVIGRVCMDQLTVDITDLPAVAIDDDVTLIGEGHTALDLAHEADTIPYEILTGISPRVKRIYK